MLPTEEEPAEPWNPGPCNWLAVFLLEDAGDGRPLQVCAEKLRALRHVSPTVKHFGNCIILEECKDCDYSYGLADVTVLDLCLLCGQRDCAELCMSHGFTEMSEWTRSPCVDQLAFACPSCGASSLMSTANRLSPPATFEQRREAASAAIQTALDESWHVAACQLGAGLFQALKMWASGKKVPASIVKAVIGFAAARPKILDLISGYEGEVLTGLARARLHATAKRTQRNAASLLVEQFCRNAFKSIMSGAASNTAEQNAIGVDTHGEHEEVQSEDDASGSADKDSADNLLTALRNSKMDMPALSPEGVVVFRLTRQMLEHC